MKSRLLLAAALLCAAGLSFAKEPSHARDAVAKRADPPPTHKAPPAAAPLHREDVGQEEMQRYDY